MTCTCNKAFLQCTISTFTKVKDANTSSKAAQESSSYHKAMVVHVHDDVLAHDSQSNQCNVCSVRGGEQ